MKAASRMLLPLCSRSLWRHPQMSLNSSALDPILFIAYNSPLRRFNIYILFTRSQLEFSTQFQRCWIRSFCSTILEPRRMLGELDCALWWPEWWGAFVVASFSTRRIDSSEYLDLFRVELFRCIRNFSKEQILIFYNKFRHRITISTLHPQHTTFLLSIYDNNFSLRRETTFGVYVFTMIGMFIYTFTLNNGYIFVVYMTSSLLGFFMTGYLPVGFEMAAELTYPEPEGTSSGILNAGAQVFGILFTMVYSEILDTYGDIAANLLMAGFLVVGTVITALIKSDLRRQNAHAVTTPSA